MPRMKPEVMDLLSEASDFNALTKIVLSLCEPYGPVHSFRFVHNRGASRVACFVELESPKQEMALARSIGARMNAAVCLNIPGPKNFGEPSRLAPPHRAQPRATLQASP